MILTVVSNLLTKVCSEMCLHLQTTELFSDITSEAQSGPLQLLKHLLLIVDTWPAIYEPNPVNLRAPGLFKLAEHVEPTKLIKTIRAHKNDSLKGS